jgi:Ca-activated chloride channel family protein
VAEEIAVNQLGWNWMHPGAIHAVWPALLVMAVLTWSELSRRATLERFLSPVMQLRLTLRPSTMRRVARLIACGFFFAFVIAALLRPQAAGEVQTRATGNASADIVVALDVSRSMLADDAAPTRLVRAKAEVSAMLERLSGHRVGLVAFAGRAAVLCPLTPDYGFFRMMLDGAQPSSISRGGTRIGDALRTAIAAFGKEAAPARLILLITDGEDQDSFPLDATKEAHDRGIAVVAVGFGSEQGSKINLVDPETGAKTLLIDPVTKQPVVSRLDGELLRKIALATDGAYVPAGVAALDLESIVEQNIKPLTRPTTESAVRTVPRELYPWFLLTALVCLLAAVSISSSPGRRWQ